ncbi:MAG: hypothetical protein P1P64_02485 [Treponemataceae bacterium]
MEQVERADYHERLFFPRDIIVLNANEKKVLAELCERLTYESEEVVHGISEELLRLENLANAMSAFPSVIATSKFAGDVRSEETLLQKMCSDANLMRELSFPTKSILGRSYLFAKFNFFIGLAMLAENYLLPKTYVKNLTDVARNVMFSIMAEDVYISILKNQNVNETLKKKISKFLTQLWEYRIDSNVEKFAYALSKVWRAREQIAPVFGTMLGTSELFLLSMELDEMWQKFMIAKIHIEEVSMTLEEFLFGISYENINLLRKELRRKGISSIGRQEVDRLLGTQQQFEKNDPRQFYYSYIERHNNAFARKQLGVAGPKSTLEEHYISFIFDTNIEL